MDEDLFSILIQACMSQNNKVVPKADLLDIAEGASSIPGQVTDARRKGENVIYFPGIKQWQMPDGTFVS